MHGRGALQLVGVAGVPSWRSGTASDRELHKARNVVERGFNRLEQFRAIATRFGKLATRHKARLHLAALILWLREPTRDRLSDRSRGGPAPDGGGPAPGRPVRARTAEAGGERGGQPVSTGSAARSPKVRRQVSAR